MRPDEVKGFAGDVFPNFEEERKRRRQAPPRGKYRPGVSAEGLEKRVLLSAGIVGSVLQVNGTSGNDTLYVYQVNATDTVIYVDDNGTLRGPFDDSVTRVDVLGLGGDDTITIETVDGQFNHALTENTKIWGDSGNDFITSGNNSGFSDSVYGGDGNDVIHAHGGNDLLHGDGGLDSIYAYDGNDTMYGGAGNDSMEGHAGNDTMYGGYGGEDEMLGGTNNDLMYGGDAGAGGNVEVEPDTLSGEGGADTLYAEGGSDSLDPGPGADFAYGGDGNDTFRGSFDTDIDWLDGGGGTDDAGTADVHYDSPEDSLFNFP